MCIDKPLTRSEAAMSLNLSIRQVKRLCLSFRLDGHKGLISKKRGLSSNRKTQEELKRRISEIICDKYHDFGPTLAHEKLIEKYSIQISLTTIRNIMVEDGIWLPKRTQKKRVYQLRERRACQGELVQLDGSDHKWFEERGPRCTLLVFIDDATSQVHLRFVRSENTFDYMKATEEYLLKNGRPIALYTDKHGVFRVNKQNIQKRDSFSQYGRALKELDLCEYTSSKRAC